MIIKPNAIIYITFYIHYFKKLERSNFKYHTTMKIIYFYTNYNFLNNNNNSNNNINELYCKSLKCNYLLFKNFILLFHCVFSYCDFTFRNLKKVL
jgi:hypothetical protein